MRGERERGGRLDCFARMDDGLDGLAAFRSEQFTHGHPAGLIPVLLTAHIAAIAHIARRRI